MADEDLTVGGLIDWLEQFPPEMHVLCDDFAEGFLRPPVLAASRGADGVALVIGAPSGFSREAVEPHPGGRN